MSEARMVSIDPSSTSTGMALFINGELNDYGAIQESSRTPADDRIMIVGGKILKALDIWNPTMVYVEYPYGSKKSLRVGQVICQLIGIIKAWCIKHGAYIEEFQPGTWRKELGFNQGSGVKREVLKKESVEAVFDIYGINVIDDISDAILIGEAAIRKYSDEEN